MVNEEKNPRVIVITGATGAIGNAIARRIAADPGCEIVLISRDPDRGALAASEIRRESGNPAVHVALADVSRPSQLNALGKGWQRPVAVLVNNAGETPEGIELQFATNVLGYFWLTQALAPHLQNGGRIVNVASYWAGDLDMSDLEFRRRRYDNNLAYRQSKQANRMLTVAFARRLSNRGITTNACHPGDVSSRLSNDLGFGGSETPDRGADTPVWLATAREVEGVSGAYFEGKRQARCRFSERSNEIEALFRYCAQRSSECGFVGPVE